MQIERTSLAWTRLSLSMAAAALVVVRLGWARGSPAVVAAGVVSLLTLLAVTWTMRHRYRELVADLHEGRRHTMMQPGPLVVLAVVVLAAGGLLLAVS
ncbi:hypothetical protein BH20ACT6_BH20ACT6_04250 [soil metagenome]